VNFRNLQDLQEFDFELQLVALLSPEVMSVVQVFPYIEFGLCPCESVWSSISHDVR
jgi:hypothetical protein